MRGLPAAGWQSMRNLYSGSVFLRNPPQLMRVITQDARTGAGISAVRLSRSRTLS